MILKSIFKKSLLDSVSKISNKYNFQQLSLLNRTHSFTHVNTTKSYLGILKINYGINIKRKSVQKYKPTQNQTQKNDITNLPYSQQISLLKNQIDQLINKKQDNEYLAQLLGYLSTLYQDHKKVKQGLIQFNRLARKIRTISAFKRSPVYYGIIADLRFYLSRVGLIQEALLVTQQCINLIKRNSKVQSQQISQEYNLFGILHFMQKSFSQSRKAFQNQAKINKALGDQTYQKSIQCQNNLGILDFTEEKYDSAELIFTKNAQLTKRVMKSKQKLTLVKHLKHFSYLEAICQLKLKRLEEMIKKEGLSQNQIKQYRQKKKQYELKISQSKIHIFDILKLQKKNQNDVSLYYQTIGSHFMNIKEYQLSEKFILKAIQYNQKKLSQPYTQSLKSNKTNYEIYLNKAKLFKLLGQFYQQRNQPKKAKQQYQYSIKQYKKQLTSLQAKQFLSILHFSSFVECCRKLFYLVSIDKQNLLNGGIGYIQTPLHIWNNLVEGIWNLPNYLVFIPYEINIQIANKLLEFGQYQTGLVYLNASVNQIQANSNLLCKKSRSKLNVLYQNLKGQWQKINSLKRQIDPQTKKQIGLLVKKLYSLSRD